MEKVKEVEAAAKWWADQLRREPDAPADTNGGVLMAIGRNIVQPLPAEQINKFEFGLTMSLLKYLDGKVWDSSDPLLGSALRSVQCDWGPDRILDEAMQYAAIKSASLRFPIKTTMWVNPRIVTVRVGYGAPEITVYKESETAE